jgi:predicted MFS family arabinose efflux permease
LGLPILTIGLFMAPLHAEFGWSRAEIAGASTCINLATILSAPFIGSLCDRIGVRRVALASLTSLTLGFLALSAMNGSLLMYYAVWFLLSAGGVGTSGIVWTRAIGSYFERNRGLALGLTLTGTAFAALLAPLTLGPLVANVGWRSGFLALSGVSFLTIPVTYVFFRERLTDKSSIANAGPAAKGVSLKIALHQANFWKIAVGVFLLILGMGSCLVHFVPMAIDAGVPLPVAQHLFASIGLAMLFGRIIIGALLDRFNHIHVSAVALAVPALACALLLQEPFSPTVTVGIAAAIFGFSAGAEVDILAFLVARHFGLRSYGAIYGCLLAFFAAGSGVGSVLTGHIRDVSGSYQPALVGGVFAFSLGALFILWLRPTSCNATSFDTAHAPL